MRNMTVDFSEFSVASDFSGVVGCATCGGFKFSFSWLGSDVRVRNLNEYGSARGSKRASHLVERAVMQRVVSELSGEYREKCAALYAE
jgi:hypothetical protein